MSTASMDFGRRRFLTATTAVVGGAGLATASLPFIASMAPSEETLAQGAPVDADVSKLGEGQLMTVIWRKKPVWIVHRTQEQLATLPKMNDQLKDPHSESAQEPEELQESEAWQRQPLARALKSNYLVVVGICTHLQCIPDYEPQPGSVDPSWVGGFFCPCHGSRYDISGRVVQGSPAPLNLPVPPYHYKSDKLIRVGELQGGEAKDWSPNTW